VGPSCIRLCRAPRGAPFNQPTVGSRPGGAVTHRTRSHAKELPHQPRGSHWKSQSSQACSTTKQPALRQPPNHSGHTGRCSQSAAQPTALKHPAVAAIPASTFLQVNSENTAMPGNTKSTNKTHSGGLCALFFNYAEFILPRTALESFQYIWLHRPLLRPHRQRKTSQLSNWSAAQTEVDELLRSP
jgi:hypothetical protein